MSVTLLPSIGKVIEEHCGRCWPEEACALLVGTFDEQGSATVKRVFLTDNIAKDRRRFFEVDPSARIKLEKELRDTAESIVGVFHSHPGGPAAPSRSDEKMVIEREFYWLIASVDDGVMADLKAFKPLQTSGFIKVPLEISTP